MGPDGPGFPRPLNDLRIDVSEAIHISELSADKAALWDAYVEAAPAATFCHRAGWKRAIEETYGHHCPFLMAEQGERVVGVLPLSRVKSRLFGHSLSSTSFCVYGGPVGESDAVVAALTDRAREIAESCDVDHIEFRSQSATQGDWIVKSNTHATFRKEIGSDPQANLLAIPRKQRAVVRKSLASALRSEIDHHPDRLFPLYAASVRNLGTPVFPKRWFRALMDVFAGKCDVLTVLDGDRPISAVLNFYFRDEVLPYYGGGLAEARKLGANDFMYYDLMCRAGAEGYTTFDFGRSKAGSGAFAFKKNFGFEARPLHYEYYLRKSNDLPDVSPANPKYRLMIAAWSRLPLPVANRLGPLLARSLG